MDGRVRYDPRRTQGNAAMVARGEPVPQCTILSETELAKLQDLIHPDAAALQRMEERQEKLDASKARQNGWSDTIQAKRKQYITDRSNRLEAEEQRRLQIDAEEAEFRETKRQQRIAQANNQILGRDERGLNMRSAILQHEVAQVQRWQVEQSIEKKSVVDEDARLYAQQVRQGAIDEVLEKAAAAKAIREKVINVKQDQSAMLQTAISARRAERQQLQLDGEEIRRAAEEETRENSARREARRAAEVALKEELTKKFSPVYSPRQRLKMIVEAPPTALDVEVEQYESKKAEQNVALSSQAQAKQSRHDARVNATIGLLATQLSTPNSKARAVEQFSSVTSMSEKLISASYERERVMAVHRKETALAPSPRDMRTTLGMSADTCIERNHNELKSPRYRERLDTQIDMLNKFEQDQRERQRNDAKYLAMIQQMQSAEKKHQGRLEKEVDVQEALQRKEGVDAEDALFRDFISAHLPTAMHPRLVAKAMAGVPAPPQQQSLSSSYR